MYGSIPIAGGDTATPLNTRKRVAIVVQAMPKDSGYSRILDAGCGAGDYVAILGDLGYDASGVEHSIEKVRTWNSTHPDDARVAQGDLMRLTYADSSFDGALLNEVLEHVPDERTALRELHRVIRPGGALLIFSPNRLYPFETHGFDDPKSGRRISPIRTFGLPWLPRSWVHRVYRPWARNYSPREMHSLLREAGFEIASSHFVWQTFENISGRQPMPIRLLRPILRQLSTLMENTPLLRAFGVSQVVVARRVS
ncbi:MAG: class I SAM-dependent methyltransferase [Gemmatimonadales bacterium]